MKVGNSFGVKLALLPECKTKRNRAADTPVLKILSVFIFRSSFLDSFAGKMK